MNKSKILNLFSWMKHNEFYRKVKIISLILLVIGIWCMCPYWIFKMNIKLLMNFGKVLIILGLSIFAFLFIYIAIRILLTKKTMEFSYTKSMKLTSDLHRKMEQPENSNSKKYDVALYNRKIVPKTFAVVTNSQVICFYYQADSFYFRNLDQRNKEAITDYVAQNYYGHCGAWQPLYEKKYKNYYINTIELK